MTNLCTRAGARKASTGWRADGRMDAGCKLGHEIDDRHDAARRRPARCIERLAQSFDQGGADHDAISANDWIRAENLAQKARVLSDELKKSL